MFTELLRLSRIFLHSTSNRNGINLKDSKAILISKFAIFFSFEENTLEQSFN